MTVAEKREQPSAVLATSCTCRMLLIWSSVNLPRFISGLSDGPKSLSDSIRRGGKRQVRPADAGSADVVGGQRVRLVPDVSSCGDNRTESAGFVPVGCSCQAAFCLMAAGDFQPRAAGRQCALATPERLSSQSCVETKMPCESAAQRESGFTTKAGMAASLCCAFRKARPQSSASRIVTSMSR